jgi:hypothetical protein
VPEKLVDSFSDFIQSKNEDQKINTSFLKWFRFYWDFCYKYNFPYIDPDSLPHFLQKLKEKNIRERDIAIARKTIQYYFTMMDCPVA